MCRFVLILGMLATVLAMACATGPSPAVAPAAPRFPDYVFPVADSTLAGADILARHQSAWYTLQGGDVQAAGRRFADIIRRAPGFYPAATGLGYVDGARQAYDEALVRFDAVLARAPGYAPALAGRGEALLGIGRREEALSAFEMALEADPGLAVVSRRVEVLRFRTLQAVVDSAKRAADEGHLDQAAEAYARAIALSPDSPYLRRELADVDRARGRLDAALAHAREAVVLDADDARSLVTFAEVQVARGAFDEAVDALDRAVALDPDPGIERRLEEVRAMSELARMPPEYRAIHLAPTVTRGDLAALIGTRLAPLLPASSQREGVFITDTRDHWAASWILAVASAGIMEVYPNYTFQPLSMVDRGELAAVVSRVLSIVARQQSAGSGQWQSASYVFADLAPDHLSYPAAAVAVTAGVMPVLDGQMFQLTRIVTGAEAVGAIERLQELARIPGP
jgi:tetratricopeptide (TPR) repeat protein